MSEWWSYRLSDILPFSPQTYFRLFELHNEALWPAQLVSLAGGLAIVALMLTRSPWSGRIVAMLLAGAWGFVAWAYLGTRYAGLNWAAIYFAYGFGAQAVLLVLAGARGELGFTAPKSAVSRAGLGLVLFALFVQPLIGPALGREWSGMELFGIAPDPTVLATLGVLLTADRLRPELLVIPLLWCGVTGAVLRAMDAPDALLMPAAGFAALGLMLYRALAIRAEQG
ncbi:MAG: DUF6064 family protein [Methyloceanibacter sp.]